jgi:hypothetical protein
MRSDPIVSIHSSTQYCRMTDVWLDDYLLWLTRYYLLGVIRSFAYFVIYSTNMHKNTLSITSEMSQMIALKEITREYKANSGMLYIDFSDASFVISRDFLLVISRRLPKGSYALVVSDTLSYAIAMGLSIPVEMAGIHAEFARQY